MRRLALLLLPALLSTAWAHPGDEYEVLSAERDGITIYVQPQTLVVKANRDVVFVGDAYATGQGASGPMQNATYAIGAEGPGEALVETQPRASGMAAMLNFSAPGAWRLLLTVNGTTVEVPLDVYPDTAVRAESNALRYDFQYAGRPAEANLHFVEDATGGLSKLDATVTARVELWENGTKLDEEIVPLQRGKSVGEFSFRHTFRAEGSYLVRVASGAHGVGYEDLPPFKVRVLPARLAEDPPVRATAGAPLALLLGLLALAALSRRR